MTRSRSAKGESGDGPRGKRAKPRLNSKPPSQTAFLTGDLQEKFDALAQELVEAREQQAATSKILQIISSSPGKLELVFKAILESATRICKAKFGVLYLCEGDAFRTLAMHNVPAAFAEARRREPLFRPPRHTSIGR